MAHISMGNTVRDNNPNWARYGQTGTVVSVQGNKVTWRSNTDNQLVTDPYNEMVKISNGSNSMRRRQRRKMQMGGNTCPPGQYMSGGQCVGGMKRGGRAQMRKGGRPVRRMQTGGSVQYCPQGNYGYDEFGNTKCV